MSRIPPLLRDSRATICVLALLFAACAMHPERRRVVEESDFIERIPEPERAHLEAEISDLKKDIDLDFENAELHRRLSVLHRLEGTPHSRLLSSEEIDRAIMLDPGNAIYRVEKGLTLAARRFVGEAKAAFVEATKLDPHCSAAWFQLGRLERDEYLSTMCYPDHLTLAIEHFDKALRRNRKDEETLLNLAFLHSLRQMDRTALQYASRAVTYHPQSARARLLAGMLLTKLKRFGAADSSFADAFRLMSEEELRPYENIAPLLQDDERDLYLSSLPDKRADWNHRFWAEADPTPATEVNERLLEHYSRVVTADWALSNERLDLIGSQSDRGAALLRFGLPDHKYFDLGSGTSGAWVIWRYDTPRGPMMLYFNDEFLNGNYHFPISDYYGEISRRTVETAPERYTYPIAYAPFPLAVEMTELRGAEERTRLEFSLAIPDSVPSGGRRWNLFLTFFDNAWNRFSSERLSLRPDSLPRVEKPGGTYRVYSSAMEILPRELGGTCVFELVDEAGKRKAVKRHPLTLRSLHGRSLKISGIKFTIPMGKGCGNALDPISLYFPGDSLCLSYEVYNLERGEKGMTTYRVSYAIQKPDPGDEEAPASIQRTLSYIWRGIRGGKGEEEPYVKSSFEQSSDATYVADNLRIDLGSLDRGTYLLVLLVEDLQTGQSASESKKFTISE